MHLFRNHVRVREFVVSDGQYYISLKLSSSPVLNFGESTKVYEMKNGLYVLTPSIIIMFPGSVLELYFFVSSLPTTRWLGGNAALFARTHLFLFFCAFRWFYQLFYYWLIARICFTGNTPLLT